MRKNGNLRCLEIYNDENIPQLSAMVWGCISHDVVGTLSPVDGNINSRKHTENLDNNLCPVVAGQICLRRPMNQFIL